MAERETSEDEVDYFFFGFLRLRVQRLLALSSWSAWRERVSRSWSGRKERVREKEFVGNVLSRLPFPFSFDIHDERHLVRNSERESQIISGWHTILASHLFVLGTKLIKFSSIIACYFLSSDTMEYGLARTPKSARGYGGSCYWFKDCGNAVS